MSYHPQTPQSPSQNSPANTDPVSSMNNSTMSSFTTALPTPAHSINGTNLPSEATHDVVMTGISPQKRKRESGDQGGRARGKRVHIDEGAPSFEALHEDVGEKYRVAKKVWTPAQPRLTDDLFEIYGLTDIAAEVARFNPDGSKNGLRKTYKGQMKKFDLTGHFDAVKKEYSDADSLLQMLDCPEDIWQVNLVKGKEIDDGFSIATRQALPRAMTMARGPISKDKWDSSVLAEFADKPAKPSKPTATAPGTPRNPALNNVLPRTKNQGVARDVSRGLRQKAKRSYNDGSFEGYEGFEDDTGLDTGYSTGEGENKRRKNKSAASRVGTPRQVYNAGPGNLGA